LREGELLKGGPVQKKKIQKGFCLGKKNALENARNYREGTWQGIPGHAFGAGIEGAGSSRWKKKGSWEKATGVGARRRPRIPQQKEEKTKSQVGQKGGRGKKEEEN